MEKKILIETSARHVHLSREDMDVLFGKGAELTVKKDLSQPGQYISHERVDVVGPKKTIASVGIIGPLRPHTQVEVSLTDARTLGVTAAVRESGKTDGTEGLKLVGPAGEVELPDGVIAAKRHIHLIPETAEKWGLENGQNVCVKIEGERSLIFDEVVVRISDKFADAMHIDTDEANAAALTPNSYGDILD